MASGNIAVSIGNMTISTNGGATFTGNLVSSGKVIYDPHVYRGVAVLKDANKTWEVRSEKPYKSAGIARGWVTRQFKTHNHKQVTWVGGYIEKTTGWERLEW